MASRKLSFESTLLAGLIGLIVAFGIAELVARVAFPQWREYYSGNFMTPILVPNRGQVVVGTPGFDGYFAHNYGDFRVHIHVNEYGLRNDEPVDAAQGRLWTIGNSLTFGWGVERDETYTSVIGKQTGLPVYNVAAPGASLCGYQALSDRMPATVRPSAVIIGLLIESDVAVYDCARAAAKEIEPERFDFSFRSLKYYLTGRSALYNLLAVATKRIDLANRLSRSLGFIATLPDDRTAPGTEAQAQQIQSTAAELARLREMFAGIPFAVLVVPARQELQSASPAFANLRRGIEERLSAAGTTFIDPFAELQRVGLSAVYFQNDGHWNAAGHEIAGEAAAEWVRGLGLIDRSRSAVQ